MIVAVRGLSAAESIGRWDLGREHDAEPAAFRSLVEGPRGPGFAQPPQLRYEAIEKRVPFRMRPRDRVGDRPHRLFRAPDQIELAVGPNPADVHGPPGVLGLVVHRHDSLRRIEALRRIAFEHRGDLCRLGLDDGLGPQVHAVIRGLDHVAGDAVGTIASP